VTSRVLGARWRATCGLRCGVLCASCEPGQAAGGLSRVAGLSLGHSQWSSRAFPMEFAGVHAAACGLNRGLTRSPMAEALLELARFPCGVCGHSHRSPLVSSWAYEKPQGRSSLSGQRFPLELTGALSRTGRRGRRLESTRRAPSIFFCLFCFYLYICITNVVLFPTHRHRLLFYYPLSMRRSILLLQFFFCVPPLQIPTTVTVSFL